MENFCCTERDDRSFWDQGRLLGQILKDDGTNYVCDSFNEESRRTKESKEHEEQISPHPQYVYRSSHTQGDVIDLLNRDLGLFPQHQPPWDSIQSHDITNRNNTSFSPKLFFNKGAVNRFDERKFNLNLLIFLAEVFPAMSSIEYHYFTVSHSYLVVGNYHDLEFANQTLLLKWANQLEDEGTFVVCKADSYQLKFIINGSMLSVIRLALKEDRPMVKVIIKDYEHETITVVHFSNFDKVTAALHVCIDTNKNLVASSYFSDEEFVSRCTFINRTHPFNCDGKDCLSNSINSKHAFLRKISTVCKIDSPLSSCESRQVHQEDVDVHFKGDHTPNCVPNKNTREIDKVIHFLLCKLDDGSAATELRILSALSKIDGDHIHIMQECKLTWFKLIKILLKHKIDVNIKDDEGNSLLHHLSAEKFWTDKSGMHGIAQKLIKAGAKIDAKNKLGFTPLHCATVGGYHQLVDVLIKNGADVNATTNENFFTPIHLAAAEKYLVVRDFPIIDSLVKSGANLEARTRDGQTLLHMAIVKKIAYSEFIQSENPWEAYYLIKYLLNLGCDVNAKDENGQTPLCLACELDCEKSVEELLRHGADVNEENKSGLTPLLCRRNEWTAARCILTSHLMKMMAAGFYVSEKNRVEILRLERLYEYLSVLKSKYLDEVKIMKEVRIDSRTSLYDLLREDSHGMAKYVKNREFTRFLFKPTRSIYHYRQLLNLQYKRGCVRRILTISAVKFLRSVVRSLLPDPCLENVIRNLSDRDLSKITAGHAVFRFRKKYQL